MTVSSVRSFNRFYTRVIGVLHEGLVHTDHPLTEARVLFELGQRDATEVTALRRDLDLDPGYLSRMLTKFEADGLVTRSRSDADARRQVVVLTPSGRTAYQMLDASATAEIEGLLAPLAPAARARLVSSMDAIRRTFFDIINGELPDTHRWLTFVYENEAPLREGAAPTAARAR